MACFIGRASLVLNARPSRDDNTPVPRGHARHATLHSNVALEYDLPNPHQNQKHFALYSPYTSPEYCRGNARAKWPNSVEIVAIISMELPGYCRLRGASSSTPAVTATSVQTIPCQRTLLPDFRSPGCRRSNDSITLNSVRHRFPWLLHQCRSRPARRIVAVVFFFQVYKQTRKYARSIHSAGNRSRISSPLLVFVALHYD